MKIKDRLFLPIFNFIGWRAKIFGDMEEAYLKAFLATIARSQAPKETKENETISVSETVSAAASVYENVRNALEYDEEHLLRRNAIRRILKRRFGEEDVISLSSDLLHELIWARYLPNNAVPTKTLDEVAAILRKFQPLFVQAEEAGKNTHHFNLWLLDVLSTEIEYKLSPPLVEEGLVGLVYQNIKSRLEWATSQIKPEDRELQLYVAVHRAVLKSNRATLRYRVFVLYFPDWSKAPTSELVEHVAGRLPQIIETVENQLNHSSGERLFRFVRQRSVAFTILRDVCEKHSGDIEDILSDEKRFRQAVAEAAAIRYDKFRVRVHRSIIRAIVFILFTKSILALLVELPFDRLVAKDSSWTPLLTNILFHPLVLAVIGLTVHIPEKKNTELLFAELQSVLGLDKVKILRFSQRRPWAKGGMGILFATLYSLALLLFVGIVSYILHSFDFSIVSIFFFLFFLSLVTFFGFKIRGSRRELVMTEGTGGWGSALFDIFFLPVVRTGRWISIRAPRVNILLFFLDFIIEAPFKAAIKLIEGWLAFLREKKEEI
ncbi:MAG: hypothetical protein UX09_C0023G0004 [Candidatus Uhrbacteria bacterium GW2011_GWE2_45_35]|uniref:Uncharacterized protein n=1 Tax=Candidatus Uhrbacteria bacterium GW2011_GWE2_45_35 TaxID=1618993 RepID=A0A0G1MI19_9BACT|nr:MAG: hypothetical protein UX09_C0023G0004 [Candidatus Uhrbacteria bacterium GW2011_GWE2_45_35]HBR80537.1 hypothetical protein [Candidatus Uhrbacteria bacterium]HCU31695.1 hypothetical protein [Candidatus Uhrbacteria bacterium]